MEGNDVSIFDKTPEAEKLAAELEAHLLQQYSDTKVLIQRIVDESNGSMSYEEFMELHTFIGQKMDVQIPMVLAIAGWFNDITSVLEIEDATKVYSREKYTDADRARMLELICNYL